MGKVTCKAIQDELVKREVLASVFTARKAGRDMAVTGIDKLGMIKMKFAE